MKKRNTTEHKDEIYARKANAKKRQGTYYAKIARVPNAKNGKTYTKIVPINTAMKLIYGVPHYELQPQFGYNPEGAPIFLGHENVLVKRVPLSRDFVRAKIAS